MKNLTANSMRYLTVLIGLILMSLGGLTSCTSDDDDEDETTTNGQSNYTSVVGTWHFIKDVDTDKYTGEVTINTDPDDSELGAEIRFYPEGIGTLYYDRNDFEIIEWSTNQNNLTITGEEWSHRYTYTISNNTLIITFAEYGYNIVSYYER